MLTSSKLLLIHKKFIGLIKRIRYICVRFTKRIILNCLQMLPFATLSGIENLILSLRISLQESIRIKQTPLKSSNLPVIQSYNEDEKLSISILDRNAPWHSTSLKQDVKIPGMITLSEKQYYLYLGRFYSGFGSIIELGPWLGLSTYYLVSGLLNNPNFKSQKIDVYDDFIWRSSWMDKWLIDVEIPIPKPKNHESFKQLFTHYMQVFGIDNRLIINQKKLCNSDGNEHIDNVDWNIASPIEMIIVDCGRTLLVNDGWWNVFSPSFVKNKTLIVMQDWQTYKQIPDLHYNQTKIFTDSKLNQIELIHELDGGSIATFIYRG